MTIHKQTSYFPQLAFVGIMFFAIGFALGINSFFIPVLNGTLGVSSAQAYLILAATFSTFIIWGYPASMAVRKIGYKHIMPLIEPSGLVFILIRKSAGTIKKQTPYSKKKRRSGDNHSP